MTFRLSSAEADRLIAFYREGIRTRSYSMPDSSKRR